MPVLIEIIAVISLVATVAGMFCAWRHASLFHAHSQEERHP